MANDSRGIILGTGWARHLILGYHVLADVNTSYLGTRSGKHLVPRYRLRSTPRTARYSVHDARYMARVRYANPKRTRPRAIQVSVNVKVLRPNRPGMRLSRYIIIIIIIMHSILLLWLLLKATHFEEHATYILNDWINKGIHLDLDTRIVPGQILKANLRRGLRNSSKPAGEWPLITVMNLL